MDVAVTVMDPDRWRMLQPLLDRALKLSPGERVEWLRAMDAESPEIAFEPSPLGLGDLDRVLAKSLRQKPMERYQTAAEFSADLQRWLQHEAVSAGATEVCGVPVCFEKEGRS